MGNEKKNKKELISIFIIKNKIKNYFLLIKNKKSRIMKTYIYSFIVEDSR